MASEKKKKNNNNVNKTKTKKNSFVSENKKIKKDKNNIVEKKSIKKDNSKSTNKTIETKNNKIKKTSNKSIKRIILIIILLVFMLFILKTSYSIYGYYNISSDNQLIAGKIYLHYENNEEINLTNILPRSGLSENDYTEFTISGINEYSKSIIYAIDLEYGTVPNNKSTKIRDDLLRFTLKEKKDNGNEVTVLENKGYEDLSNARIWVDSISSQVETVHTYKLYCWISDDILFGNVPNADYTEAEWNDIYASIKIKVTGDFSNKTATRSVRVNFDGNGGTISTSYKYIQGDTYGELPSASRSGYVFEGWRASNGTKIHDNKELQSDEEHTLTAVWAIVKYSHVGDYVFDGTNYINTGVPLFGEETADKNFYISFDIKSINSNNNSNGVFINLKQPNNNQYGFLLARNGSANQIKFSSNGNAETYLRSNIYYGPQNIKIIRINNIIYYSLNNGGFTKAGDYTDFSNYFDDCVTFGASLTSNSTPQYYFKGTLSNMMIKLIVGDDVSLDDYLYSTDHFQYDGDFVFNGSTAINTGVYLFSEENASRDFYISFDIKNINWGNVNQATLMSAKDETGSPWPGFELRRYGTSNTSMQSKATVASGVANDVKNIPKTTQNIRFLRVNKKLYYSLDNAAFVLHNNFTNFTLYFDVPVVFGNAYNVETQRYFNGTLANMIVQFIEREEALEICGSTCST